MKESDIETVDLSQEIEAIKKEFGSHYYKDERATKKAAALWGETSNECGVFEKCSFETIVKTNHCKGEIQYANTSKGYWLIGVSAQTALFGFGYAPSVWDRKAYKSYYDARLAGVFFLHDFFNTAVNGGSSQAQKTEIMQALAHLNGEKTPQLGLF